MISLLSPRRPGLAPSSPGTHCAPFAALAQIPAALQRRRRVPTGPGWLAVEGRRGRAGRAATAAARSRGRPARAVAPAATSEARGVRGARGTPSAAVGAAWTRLLRLSRNSARNGHVSEVYRPMVCGTGRTWHVMVVAQCHSEANRSDGIASVELLWSISNRVPCMHRCLRFFEIFSRF